MVVDLKGAALRCRRPDTWSACHMAISREKANYEIGNK